MGGLLDEFKSLLPDRNIKPEPDNDSNIKLESETASSLRTRSQIQNAKKETTLPTITQVDSSIDTTFCQVYMEEETEKDTSGYDLTSVDDPNI